MVTRLGPAARGAALPHATAQTALASASRRKLIDGPFGQARPQQDDTGHHLVGCVAQAPASDAGGEKLPASIRAVERAVTSSSHCITNHATRQGMPLIR